MGRILTFDLGRELLQSFFRVLPTVVFIYAEKHIIVADDVDQMENSPAPCASDQFAVYNVRCNKHPLVPWIGSSVVRRTSRVRRVKYGGNDEQKADDGQQDVEAPP